MSTPPKRAGRAAAVTTSAESAAAAPTAAEVRAALQVEADPEKAAFLAGFFKTGPGQYAEGDRFLGVTVPVQRTIVRRFRALSHPELIALLHSDAHEERLTALLILVAQYESGGQQDKEACFRLYLDHLPFVNNWDLVDASARQIVGTHLLGGEQTLLDRLAESSDLWSRRVAIVATYAFTMAGDPAPTFRIAERLLQDPEDLIHKAVGWMLREVGKRVGEGTLRQFLRTHAPAMPRTALRYAIERFPAEERLIWLAVKRR